MNQYANNYPLARVILKFHLYIGLILAGLGVILVLLGLFLPKVGFFSAGIEFRYGQSRPFWVLLLDLLPGLCVLGYGLMTIVVVYVAGAILDSAETNEEILRVQKKLLSQLTPKSEKDRQSTPKRGEHTQSDVLNDSVKREVYKRTLITRIGDYYYVSGIRFTDEMSAKSYIDSSVNLPPSSRPPG